MVSESWRGDAVEELSPLEEHDKSQRHRASALGSARTQKRGGEGDQKASHRSGLDRSTEPRALTTRSPVQSPRPLSPAVSQPLSFVPFMPASLICSLSSSLPFSLTVSFTYALALSPTVSCTLTHTLPYHLHPLSP